MPKRSALPLQPDHVGKIISSRDGWIVDPRRAERAAELAARREAKAKRKRALIDTAATRRGFLSTRPDPHVLAIRGDVDISVAGLGAYRSYRSHPGKNFPSRALTCSTGDRDKDVIKTADLKHTSL